MSQSIAFIGVGNMGCPMAENLMKAGKSVKVFDVSKKMLDIAKDKNLKTIENLDDLITTDVETVMRCFTGISGSEKSRSNTREKAWYFFTCVDI